MSLIQLKKNLFLDFWMDPRKFKNRVGNWAREHDLRELCWCFDKGEILRLRFAPRRMTIRSFSSRFCDSVSLRAEWHLLVKRVRREILKSFEFDESDKTWGPSIRCQPSIVSFCTEDVSVRSCRIHHRFCNIFWGYVSLRIKWQLDSAIPFHFTQNDNSMVLQ